jgi:hypothetical protein
MQFTDEVDWTAGDFVFAGPLMFGALGAYELAARSTGNALYRAGVGVALASAVLLLWANAAVGITDSAADAMYAGVPAVAVLGAIVARFQPHGMALAMLGTALAQAAVGVIALTAEMVPQHNSPVEIIGIIGFFTALFVGSALLFREAARGT